MYDTTGTSARNGEVEAVCATVTLADPDTPVPLAGAVTVVVPFATTVTSPLPSTDTIAVLTLAHANVVPGTTPLVLVAEAESWLVAPRLLSATLPGVTGTDPAVVSTGSVGPPSPHPRPRTTRWP